MDAVNNLHATAFTTGAGDSSDEPFGIVTALAAASPSVIVPGGGETLDPGDPYLLQNALPPRWQANSRWTAALPTINEWRQAETTNGALKFPSLQDSSPTLLGRGVFENSSMGTDDYVAILGDWNQFLIVDRVGASAEIVSHLFSPSNFGPTGQRGLWLWGRVGADCLVSSAFRMLSVPPGGC